MAALEIQGNGDSGTLVTDEHIQRTIDSLEDAQQKDFIQKCLQDDPSKRSSARDLLFHSLLFEVHSLKLLAAHCVVNSARKSSKIIPFIPFRKGNKTKTCIMIYFPLNHLQLISLKILSMNECKNFTDRMAYWPKLMLHRNPLLLNWLTYRRSRNWKNWWKT